MSDSEETAELRRRNLTVVESFFSSDLAKPEERLAVWHDNGVKELPFAPKELPKTRWDGRDEIIANTLANTGMFANCVHRDIEIIPCEDPALFFVKSRMVDEATFLGEPYPQSFVHELRVEDGKIILQREYFNSQILAQAEAAARAHGQTPEG